MSAAVAKRPFRIVLTGGIASGKSAVAQRFAELGVPIIDTDVLARRVVEPNTPGLQKVVEHFGRDILDATGGLDRRHLRERIFANEAERKFLEDILHPLIRQEQERLTAELGGPYQIHVVPLLVESGTSGLYDRVLVVDCPPELQLARLMARDSVDAKTAERMLAAQVKRDERLRLADDVIENIGELAALNQQVDDLHSKYLALAAGSDPRG